MRFKRRDWVFFVVCSLIAATIITAWPDTYRWVLPLVFIAGGTWTVYWEIKQPTK